MNLYFIGDGTDEESFDLLVRAATPERAAELWRAYYTIIDADTAPERIFLVPPGDTEGALAWHAGVNLVAGDVR